MLACSQISKLTIKDVNHAARDVVFFSFTFSLSQTRLGRARITLRAHASLSLSPPPPPPPPPPYHYYFLCRFAGKERALSLPVSDKKNFEGYQGHQNYKFHKNKLLRISLRVCCWYENKKYVVLSFETELFDLWKKRLPLLVSVQ